MIISISEEGLNVFDISEINSNINNKDNIINKFNSFPFPFNNKVLLNDILLPYY